MDQLKSCKICGRLLEENETSKICSNCISSEDSDFIKIKEYLYDHPRASIYEVASVLGITINKIKFFLREGRIEIVEGNNQFLLCEICGKPIHSGKYCDDCYRHGTSEIKGIYTGGASGLKSETFKSPKEAPKLNYYTKDGKNYKR